MKKSTLTRKRSLSPGKPMERGGPPTRRVGVKKVNARRRQQRFNDAFESEAFVEFTRSKRCAVCNAQPPSECAHARSRAAGGRASDVFAACSECHRIQHEIGVRTFEAIYGCDLRELAKAHYAAWQASRIPEPYDMEL